MRGIQPLLLGNSDWAGVMMGSAGCGKFKLDVMENLFSEKRLVFSNFNDSVYEEQMRSRVLCSPEQRWPTASHKGSGGAVLTNLIGISYGHMK